MKSLIVSSLCSYIEEKVKDAYSENIIQFRIPAKTYSISVVFDLLDEIDKLCSSVINCKGEIKIAKQAIIYYRKNANDKDLEKVEAALKNHPSWEDKHGNLTAYRNKINSTQSGYKILLILVGDDLIDDQASLSHFLDCGIQTLWENVLDRSFKAWVNLVISQYKYDEDDKNDIDNSVKLLQTALRYSDLPRIDDFLRGLTDSSNKLSRNIGNNFDKLGLQIIDVSSQTNVDKSLTITSKARSYYNRNASLETISTAIKKIERLIEKVEKDINLDDKKIKFLQDKDKYPEFDSPSEYLNTCKSIVSGSASDEERKKFIKSDAATFVLKVLGFKPEKEDKSTIKVISGMPFTAVLHAVWISLHDFLVENSKEIKSREVGIEEIEIVSKEFTHNYASSDPKDKQNNEAVIQELIRPYLGGVDQLIKNTFASLKNDIGGLFSNVTINSHICPADNDHLSTPFKATATPSLLFSVTVRALELGRTYSFKIPFKKSSPINYSRELILKEKDRISTSHFSTTHFIPVFSFSKFNEFFDKTDSESDDFFEGLIWDSEYGINASNILDLNADDNIKNKFYSLRACYENFINCAATNGIYFAIVNEKSIGFCKEYQNILKELSSEERLNQQSLRIRMLKAYWIMDKKDTEEEQLSNKNFKAGCLSILHPAMIEMLYAQICYIRDNVAALLRIGKDEGDPEKRITEDQWQRIEDLSTIQAPIPCVLDDDKLKTQTKGSDLLFKIGSIKDAKSDDMPLSVTFEDEMDLDADEISDSDLTRMTDESKLICNLLSDYIDSYGFASDSLKIAIFMPVNIQAIMAAIISLIKTSIYPPVSKNESKRYPYYPFKLNISFYSDPEDEGRIGLWISKFNNYFNEKTLNDNDFANVDLTIGYRMIKTGSDNIITKGIEMDFQADISILYESHDASIWEFNRGLQTSLIKIPQIDERKVVMKFPMLEKLYPKRPISANIGNSAYRSKLISNRQFKTYDSYLKLLYSVDHDVEVGANESIVVAEQYDFSKWLTLLNWCLDRSERVIAIGGEIDKDLILNANNFNKNESKNNSVDIVGFGSGVGANASLNYIVASRLYENNFAEENIRRVFQDTFLSISASESKAIVSQLLADSKEMADLSLVRTLSCYNYYSNNYLGYAMIRHVLKPEDGETPFCDVVISLDSYRHWFSSNDIRADLLWVVAYKQTEKLLDGSIKHTLKLKLTVIESKLGYDADEKYLDKAYKQIQSTIKILQRYFMPATQIDDKYDSRYWWMQLHRIVSSNTYIKKDEEATDTLEALEYLAEGDFSIDWESYIFSFNQTSSSKTIEKIEVSDDEGSAVTAVIMHPCGIKDLMSHNVTESFKEFMEGINQNNIPYKVSMGEKEFKKAKEEEQRQKRMELSGEPLQAFGFKVVEKKTEDSGVDDSLYFAENDESFGNVEEYSFAGPELANVPEETISFEFSEHTGEEFQEKMKMVEKNWGKEESASNTNQIKAVASEIDDNLILIGKTLRGEEPVYWNIASRSNLPNRHMFILGTSGTGKSYAIKAIMGELSKKLQSSLIVDYTDGFIDDGLSGIERFVGSQYYVKKGDRLPINPFKLQEENYDDPYDVGKRVSDVFSRIYQIGDNQKSILADTIERGLFDNDVYTMDMLLNDLEKGSQEKGPKKTSFITLLTKIKPFCKSNPFIIPEEGRDPWKDIFFNYENNKQITIFQLRNLTGDIKIAVAEFVLWDLWYYIVALGAKQERLHTIILDEIQNLNINNDDAPVVKYLTEGRKFGFGVIAASQGITGLGGLKSKGLDALLNAGTMLIFQPKSNDQSDFAKMLNQIDSSKTKDEWNIQLGRLKKGECIYVSSDENSGKRKARVIKITSMEERGF